MLDPFVLLVCALLALFVVLLIVGTGLGIACSQIRATKRRIGRLEDQTARLRQIEERRVMSRTNGRVPLFDCVSKDFKDAVTEVIWDNFKKGVR